MIAEVLFNIFVCVPAGLFYAAILIYICSRSKEKKHKKMYEDDGK